MQYKILKISTTKDIEGAIEELEGLVNKKMKDGWRPQGGVSINYIELKGASLKLIAQAMVKEEN